MTLNNTILDDLDEKELKYVMTRIDAESNAEALRVSGLSKGWLRARNVADLNARAEKIRKNKAMQAIMDLSGFLKEAIEVKGAGLKARDERVRQSVATEIIERFLGKPSASVAIDVSEDKSKSEHEALMDALKEWRDANQDV